MWNTLRALDAVLRGEATHPSRLQDGKLRLPLPGLTVFIVLLGAFYGFCMGWFALVNRDTPEYAQVAASMVKVPALFVLTLLVTLPSLYVFNALVGSRLSARTVLQVLVASLAVILAVLASFGPIVAFFSLTTTNYPFMGLLNVAVFTLAGLLGLGFLLQTMHRLSVDVLRPRLPDAPVPPPTSPPAEPPAATPAAADNVLGAAGALERLPGAVLGRNVRIVFVCWVAVFGLVGAQMSWVLRPFIGDPSQPFEWFRHRESNFFEAVGRALMGLFS
jgi:hypothetical protein